MLSLSFSSRLSSNDRSSWGKKRMSSDAMSTSTLPMGNTSGISTPQFPLTNPSHTGLEDSSSLQSNTGDVSLAPPLAAYRSVSSPTTPSLPKVTPKVTKHSSLQSTPTQPTLKVDPRILSVSDAGTGSGKMLSPIVEQDYFSPARRSVALPTDSGVQTQDVTLPPPISKFSDAPRSSPVHPTFLARPLKRSISQMSQTSSRTHMSTVTAPPTIPPIDLLPVFSGHLDSWRAPSVVSGPYEYSGTYGDNSSLHPDSFISALSTPSPPYSGSETGQVHTHPYYSPADVGSLRSATADGIPHSKSQSSFSSYVGQRWMTNLSFGSGPLNFQTKPREFQKCQKNPSQMTPARLLFWLGFVAPWCWMIGGWVLTRSGKTRAEKDSSSNRIRPSLLPLWNSKTSEKGIEGKKVQEGYKLGKGYPFVAPSIDTLASQPNGIHRTKSYSAPTELDPWVRRCRKASVVSGFVFFVIFTVVCVIVGRRGIK